MVLMTILQDVVISLTYLTLYLIKQIIHFLNSKLLNLEEIEEIKGLSKPKEFLWNTDEITSYTDATNYTYFELFRFLKSKNKNSH